MFDLSYFALRNNLSDSLDECLIGNQINARIQAQEYWMSDTHTETRPTFRHCLSPIELKYSHSSGCISDSHWPPVMRPDLQSILTNIN